MAAYTVSTIKTQYSRFRPPEMNEPFQVVVQDECDVPIARLGAMTPDHARMVAGALVLLLPKLAPGRTVVLDASFNGRTVGQIAA